MQGRMLHILPGKGRKEETVECKGIRSYFSSRPTVFGFHAANAPENIMLKAANKKTGQSLLDFRLTLEQLLMLL